MSNQFTDFQVVPARGFNRGRYRIVDIVSGKIWKDSDGRSVFASREDAENALAKPVPQEVEDQP